ncbi:hypothetical protein D1818_22125 [Aquimarina sp. BL5]|uniref:GNAT family N-acetyltransferase n=1 Tax=Aquimarina sp. BL5 TaxID=1714860 RepID=UPI000E51B8CA|nr:hypothetical protein D1818_22125 [Aquimarina sp. BL5]RKM87759.1 hypothetical protein D7036_24595 [Aquimarina sp. BL5]
MILQQKNNISRIELIVHKENLKTIEFYKRMGYKLLDIVPNHFETGQIIENYQMVKILAKK